MSLAKYLFVFLVCLKGISASSDIKHVTLGDTHFIKVSDENYAIVFLNNEYTWKVAMVNGNDLTTIDGLCNVEHRKMRDDRNSRLYEKIRYNMSPLYDASQLVEIGCAGQEFSVEVIDSQGRVETQAGGLHPLDATEVLSFSVPFSNLKARLLVNKHFIGTIDPMNRIRMYPNDCLPLEHRKETYSRLNDKRNLNLNPSEYMGGLGGDSARGDEWAAELSESPLARLSSFDKPVESTLELDLDSSSARRTMFQGESSRRGREQSSPDRMSRSESARSDSPSWAWQNSYDPFDFLARNLDEGEPFEDPDNIMARLQEMLNREDGSTKSNFQRIPKSYRETIENLLDRLQIHEKKCTPEGFAGLHLLRHNSQDLQGTNINNLISQKAKAQLQLCYNDLESGVRWRQERLAPEVRQQVLNFLHQLEYQVREDGHTVPLDVRQEIPVKSLYESLAQLIRCKDSNLEGSIKKSPKELVANLLVDSVERHLGAMCYHFERIHMIDLKQLDILTANQSIDDENVHKFSEDVANALNAARACQSLNQNNLSPQRLSVSFQIEPSNKFLSCFLPH